MFQFYMPPQIVRPVGRVVAVPFSAFIDVAPIDLVFLLKVDVQIHRHVEGLSASSARLILAVSHGRIWGVEQHNEVIIKSNIHSNILGECEYALGIACF